MRTIQEQSAAPSVMKGVPLNDISISTTVENITPQLAKELLLLNTSNRSLSDRTVDFYAQQMKSGNWMLNGESIIIDSDGRLLNGQHRLHACIKSGVSFQTLVVRNVDSGAFKTLDAGKKRSVSDVLGIAGIKHATRVAPGARLFYLGLNQTTYDAPEYDFTNETALELCESYPQIEYWAAKHKSIAPAVIPSIVVGALALLEVFHGKPAAEKFYTKAVCGHSLGPKDPEHFLRQMYLSSRANKALQQRARYNYMLKAANLSAKGKQISMLKILENEKVLFWKG